MERFAVLIFSFTFFLILTKELGSTVNGLSSPCSRADLAALFDFKSGLNDPEDRLSSWRGSNCCQWRGIGCDNVTGAVISVDLHNPHPSFSLASPRRYGFWNLSGEIRPSLLQLESLQYLDLSFNTFGQIPVPEFLGSLKKLRYLNLANAGFGGPVPASLGNLSRLQTLDISSDNIGDLTASSLDWMSGLVSLKHLAMESVNLSSAGSNWLAILNMLPLLTDVRLSSCDLSGPISNLGHVNFTFLSVLELSLNPFNSLFPSWVLNMSSLTYIGLDSCSLYGRIPLGLSELPNLQHLYLGSNKLSASCYQLFQGSWPKIEDLSLSTNQLHGRLPSNIGNMTFLTIFDLLNNNVEGGLPSSISRLCNLQRLYLDMNNLTGSLPEVLEPTTCNGNRPLPSLTYLGLSMNNLTGNLPEWLGQIENLVVLSAYVNLISGPIPASLGNLRNLQTLTLGVNHLNGTLPDNLGQLSQLYSLDVSFNDLSGFVTEAHFAKLGNLTKLILASSSLNFNVSPNWIPPFQLDTLDIGSCNLGPSFPNWIEHQRSLEFLNISETGISGTVPSWLWDISSRISLLNMSFNQLQGKIHNSFVVAPGAFVDFRSNLLEGPLPLPVGGILALDLSNNKFSGPIPQNIGEIMPALIFLSFSGNKLTGSIPATVGAMSSLLVINLSNNRLEGTIPANLGRCFSLEALDLSSNSLSGAIPVTLGQLAELQSLHLSSNSLTGCLPSSLKNLSYLETLDLGDNRLSGSIPLWIGDTFPSLRLLSLRSNSFSGEIPSALSNLSSLQVLDLAGNNLTGTIPAALGDLKSMRLRIHLNKYLLYGTYAQTYYEENYVVNMKEASQKYTKTLSLVVSIDLSGNKLHGEFPEEITKLEGLVALNFSNNQITGQIPDTISNLRNLLSLDLSNNRFSGAIPSSMSSLSFLGTLKLSYNNFSGMIPEGGEMLTFTAEFFAGNPFLCGRQVHRSCLSDNYTNGEGTATEDDDHEGESFIDDQWFYLSLGLGFAAGLLVPMLIIAMFKPWREAYFGLVDRVAEILRWTKNSRAAHCRIQLPNRL